METPAHLRLAYIPTELKAQPIGRHNGAVKNVMNAVNRGRKGGSEFRWDPCGLNKTACKYTVAPEMLTCPPIPHVDHEESTFQYPVGTGEDGDIYTPINPDIVMVERERQEGWDDGETLRKANGKKEGEAGANHLIGRMWMIEVTFVWDSMWKEKEKAKTAKYESLAEQLKSVGWEVEFIVLVLGVTGISRDLFTEYHIRGLGLTKASCRLLDKNMARSSWGYVRSLWVARCIAFSAWEVEVGAGGVDEGAGGTRGAAGAGGAGGAGIRAGRAGGAG
jgi:hypothetical protein